MPKLNGYDATRKIRKSARDDRNIPIIAFTADAYDDDVKKLFYQVWMVMFRSQYLKNH